jgi:cyclophilin family peptidyl-prolyl cis-trans isomerase/HEAT repeat protein
VTCSSPRPIRFACSVALFLLLLVAGRPPAPAVAQQPSADETLVGQLAVLLAAADARRLDPIVFRDALAHPNPAVRRQAALAAGRIGDTAAVDLLVPVLADTTEAVRAAAAFALGLLKSPRALPALLQVVHGAAPAEQGAPELEAVTAIAKIGATGATGAGASDEGARALVEVMALGSPGAPTAAPPVVAAALLEAWRLGNRAPVPQLTAFAESPDVGTRWRALYALGRVRARQGATRLVAALDDRQSAVRAVAARGVSRALLDSARIDRRGAIDRLRPLLRDADAQVRINALRALGSFRDSGLASVVAPLASDPHLGVAVQAETTLGALGGSAAVATLRPRLTSSVFALRRQAVIALAQADSVAGAAAATALLSESDWRWRSVAAEAFGAARARGPLDAQLADADARVVAQALQTLQRVVPAEDTALTARARRLLVHADPAVRSVAADILGGHPDPADVDALVAAYQRAAGDPFNDARLSAVGALGAIAAASPTGRLRVAERFVAVVPRPDDYLVRRRAADTLPDAREAWGPAFPIATGRSAADYRDVARRWLAPVLSGQANPRVTLETDRGVLVIELLPAEAPLTVAAFLDLVERRFFDGTRWHRVVPNFVVQDGDPRGDGWGGPGFVLRDEVNPVRYEVGTVGMALSGPDTGGSQYFITHSAQPHLDGIYTVFGRVVSGGGVLEAIAMGDRIRSIHR